MSQTFKEFCLNSIVPVGLLPLVIKKSTIKTLERNKNPIFIHLEDGTKLYLNWDEFKRIKGGEPKNGAKMLVVMQRRAEDDSPSLSQIQQLKIIA